MADQLKQTEAPVSCQCCDDPKNLTNEAGQSIAILQTLQNPQVLEFIGNRLRSTWTVPYKAFVEIDGRTFEKSFTRIYKAGKSIKFICVDERDVDNLLERRLGMLPVFRRWHPMNAEVAKEIGRSNQNPALPSNMGTLRDTRGEDKVQAAVAVTSFNDIEGIGRSTSIKLVEAGYDVQTLADYDAADDEQILEISSRAQISKPLAIKAINGSYVAYYENGLEFEERSED